MIKLVIFDMDGVLIDSEPLHELSRQEIYKKYNISVTNSSPAIGKSKRVYYEEITKDIGLNKTPEELTVEEFDILLKMCIEKNLQPTKGLIELLNYLKENNFKIAIASSSDRSFVEGIVNFIKIEKYIDYIVTGTDEKKLKPFPDLYLNVLNHFNYSSNEALAIEDSTTGSQAAQAAKIKCVGYQDPNV